MDIAAMSVAMASSQVRSDASLAVMDNVMDVSEQQGLQLLEMLQEPAAAHPTLGNSIDIKL
ncbi:YjfB family protein [Oceanobacillus massiliensis]|uniref:YjfB family protein n=1 Tax=Oceanobacillus massiliensis TaxID=1465765 RepID=UPI00301B6019